MKALSFCCFSHHICISPFLNTVSVAFVLFITLVLG